MSDMVKAIDAVVELKAEAILRWLGEVVTPIVKEAEAENRRIFEKAYKEVRDLEAEE